MASISLQRFTRGSRLGCPNTSSGLGPGAWHKTRALIWAGVPETFTTLPPLPQPTTTRALGPRAKPEHWFGPRCPPRHHHQTTTAPPHIFDRLPSLPLSFSFLPRFLFPPPHLLCPLSSSLTASVFHQQRVNTLRTSCKAPNQDANEDAQRKCEAPQPLRCTQPRCKRISKQSRMRCWLLVHTNLGLSLLASSS